MNNINDITLWFTTENIIIAAIILFTLIFFRYFAVLLIQLTKNKLIKNGRNHWGDYLESFKNPISFGIIVIGVYASTLIIKFPEAFSKFLTDHITALVLIAFFWGLYNLISRQSLALSCTSKVFGDEIGEDLKFLLVKILKLVVFLIAIALVLDLFKFDVKALVVGGFGIVGIALALSAQETIKNWFGTATIFFDKTFYKGDTIKINNFEGTVKFIGIRTTTLKDPDLGHVIIPNSTIINVPVINYSRRSNRKIEWKISVRASTSSEALNAITDEMMAWIVGNPLIERDKAKLKTFVFLDTFNDGMIDIFCRFYTKTSDYVEYLQVKDQAIKAFKNMFEAHEINLNKPASTVVIEQNESE